MEPALRAGLPPTAANRPRPTATSACSRSDAKQPLTTPLGHDAHLHAPCLGNRPRRRPGAARLGVSSRGGVSRAGTAANEPCCEWDRRYSDGLGGACDGRRGIDVLRAGSDRIDRIGSKRAQACMHTASPRGATCCSTDSSPTFSTVSARFLDVRKRGMADEGEFSPFAPPFLARRRRKKKY